MSELVDLLADWFVGLALFVVLVGAVLALRLERRISRGATSAGPAATPAPAVPGLKATAWDLAGIDAEIRRSPARGIEMAYQLARDAGVTVPPTTWGQSPDQQTAEILDHVERALGMSR